MPRRRIKSVGRVTVVAAAVLALGGAGVAVAVAATSAGTAIPAAAPTSQFTVTNGTIRTAKGSPAEPSGTEAVLWGDTSSAATTIQGSGRVIIGAIGSNCTGWPTISVTADGKSLGTAKIVSATNYDSYRIGQASVAGLAAGTHSVSIAFTNDYSNATCDRNVAIGWARMENPASVTFTHPGVGVTKSQLDDIKAKIAAKQAPWYTAYTTMAGKRYASLSWTPQPVDIIKCASAGEAPYIEAHLAEHPEWAQQGCSAQTDDAIAAQTDALMYYFSGNAAYAQKSIQIMNAWSQKLTAIWFDQPRDDQNRQIFNQGILQSAWTAQTITKAAEIIRYTYTPAAGATAFDVTSFSSVLTNILLPLTINGWSGGGANWETSMADATIQIGVFTNSVSTYLNGINDWRDQVPAAFYLTTDVPTQPQLAGSPIPPPNTNNDKSTTTAAAMKSYWKSPLSYVDGLQGETCRDLSHMTMGFEGMAFGAETARIQGINLYGEQKTRITKALEYNALLVNAADAGDLSPAASVCSTDLSFGGVGYKLGWEVSYNAYANRLGVSLPQTKALISRIRPTGTGLYMDWESLLYGAPL